MHAHTDLKIEELDGETCRALLATADIGRVAWSQLHDGIAQVSMLPVNFAMHEGDVVFCTGAGGKLGAVNSGRRISFEADDIEPAMSVGWSVVATGYATEVAGAERHLLQDLVQPWDRSPKPHVVRLHIDSLTGRRIRPHPSAVRTVRIGPQNTAPSERTAT